MILFLLLFLFIESMCLITLIWVKWHIRNRKDIDACWNIYPTSYWFGIEIRCPNGERNRVTFWVRNIEIL